MTERRNRLVMAVIVAVSRVAGQEVAAPLEATNQLASPDGIYALFAQDHVPEQWIEDLRTRERRMVFEVTIQTLTLRWSPDSRAFIANDRAMSDVENAYLFDAATLERLDLGGKIVAAAGAREARFLPGNNQHSYIHAIRWLDVRHVEVQLRGHTDGRWNGSSVTPGDCFDFRYRVSRDGAVEKQTQRMYTLGSKACDGIE